MPHEVVVEAAVEVAGAAVEAAGDLVFDASTSSKRSRWRTVARWILGLIVLAVVGLVAWFLIF
jgi:hypothetical protein